MAQAGHSQGSRLAQLWARFVHIYEREIWQSALLKDRSLKGCTFAVLRVVSITITAFIESRIATRAAALSFSSLLALGPLIGIGVMMAGFALKQKDPAFIANKLADLIRLVAPQIQQYEVLMQDPNAAEPNPELVRMIKSIIEGSQSAVSATTTGIFALVFIVLLLFKSIEDTFNDIWGVGQGRSVLMRVVLYWTVLTLGAILFFSTVAFLGTSMFANMLGEKDLYLGGQFHVSINLALPFSFTLLAILLTLFYRVIPNTRVFWRAAVIGGLVVAVLLLLNNFLTFLYVKRVVLEKSLYGTTALPLVVMSALYIWWLCVLTGGTVSYAIQNVHFRNSQAAWSTLSESMRERLALVVFLTICRRFRECLPPISASMLSEMLKVPTQLLNECLNRLVRLQLVSTLRPPPNSTATDYLYHPARPLNRLTLLDFKTLDDNLGEDPIGTSLERIDPLIAQYERALNRLGEQEFFQQTVEQLFENHPFEESRPPFAMGQQRPVK